MSLNTVIAYLEAHVEELRHNAVVWQRSAATEHRTIIRVPLLASVATQKQAANGASIAAHAVDRWRAADDALRAARAEQTVLRQTNRIRAILRDRIEELEAAIAKHNDRACKLFPEY